MSADARLVLFDMDHTLIDNDCDVSWKKFLVDRGLAPSDALREADRFFAQYAAGELDVREFLHFQLAEFRGHTPEKMQALARDHFKEIVKPRIYEDARAEVDAALQGDRIVGICTSTNDVVAAPLAEHLGIPHLLATRLRVADGRFTGEIEGTYCGGEGKLLVAQNFCAGQGVRLEDAAYYGDSVADIPLLAKVGYPAAVNPGTELRKVATEAGWDIRRFR